MKNMKSKFLRKLKPTWKPDLFLQPNPQTQTLQTSNPSHKPKKNLNLITSLAGQDSTPPPDTRFDIKLADMENADDVGEKTKPNSGGVSPRPEIDTPSKNRDKNHHPPPPKLSDFEEKCPPGGKDILVLYTTSLRGIRKTFEDCNSVRFLLESFRVVYSERDVSMHLEYRQELWGVMGGRVVPPRLFVRGKYVGGADEVVGLHEKGFLSCLLSGIPSSPSGWGPCAGCGGVRFVLCVGCSGSRRKKVVGPAGEGVVAVRCGECNENGLVKCSVCG